MRAGVRVGRVGVSGRVPGPRSATKNTIEGVGGILMLPIMALTLATYILTAVLWVIVFVVKAVIWLLKAVTVPIWAPLLGLRGMHRHHQRKVVAGHVAWAKAQQARHAAERLAQAPTGQRVG